MLKNPFLNALFAAGYIVVIVLAIQNITGLTQGKETILVPMIMLSLFVLSAAIMGLLFVYTPAKMFLDNQKAEALVFFSKTVGTFACFAILFVILLFLF
jgi:hypothetical protein